MSKLLFQHQIFAPGKNANCLFRDTKKWIEQINALNYWSIIEIDDPNRIKIKYVSAGLTSISIFVYFIFIFENEKVSIFIEDELNGKINTMMWKDYIEEYYKYMNIDFNINIIKELYNKDELKNGIYGVSISSSILLVIAYFFFYFIFNNKINLVYNLLFIFVMVFLLEISYKPIRKITSYYKKIKNL